MHEERRAPTAAYPDGAALAMAREVIDNGTTKYGYEQRKLLRPPPFSNNISLRL
ncbi:hypothetical protein HZZ13_00480 [Bradyrhizobium sp. CNPSo 4010]|uniref:Uncharacterized protein n=1 Tax=Bradyrhizobium agreste TaxID=2751811 RepID=A0ABS0PGI1_9BRAD|nr:hypothetical protein [Bradyrhizobium agreste]MBH5396301.1 hypothetical protein [Bradyrhizobium agreste]